LGYGRAFEKGSVRYWGQKKERDQEYWKRSNKGHYSSVQLLTEHGGKMRGVKCLFK